MRCSSKKNIDKTFLLSHNSRRGQIYILLKIFNIQPQEKFLRVKLPFESLQNWFIVLKMVGCSAGKIQNNNSIFLYQAYHLSTTLSSLLANCPREIMLPHYRKWFTKVFEHHITLYLLTNVCVAKLIQSKRKWLWYWFTIFVSTFDTEIVIEITFVSG